ncbi:SRPBCC family protein [Methylomonas sp. CM2]|uniref:SRPBCC family protein n=1 Tax=Methylomonas sp. CM2 TaxID=3417647 RepID=UPI003CE782D7
MPIKLPFDATRPVAGQASVEIEKPITEVFDFVGTRFFDNYPKWAEELLAFQALDGEEVFVGAKARQCILENGEPIESVFEITEYQPEDTLIFRGLTSPYRHSYLLEGLNDRSPTRLTFRFELLNLDVFMRPFEKLIRAAIEDGAENTVENIRNLIVSESP